MPSGRITADAVWKKYRRGERFDSLRELIPGLIRQFRERGANMDLREREFWALRDVSFDVKAGEALGIIGRNGAGKSTILKLLSRIIKPTRGTVSVVGRSAALIEVAAGFHPDLTGRENIYLQGAILGLPRRILERRLDEIITFSGIEAFIDTPVKRYSSGMNARLGFSIAVHIDPDVLLIDEVLAVGDLAFQARCVNRMRDFKRDGVAIVFVSHNMQAVTDLCDQAILFNGGVEAHGRTDDVINHYLTSSQTTQAGSSGDGVDIRHIGLLAEDESTTSVVRPGAPLQLVIEGTRRGSLTVIEWTLAAYRSTDGTLAYEAEFPESFATEGLGMDDEADFRSRIDLRANLTRGIYHLELIGRTVGERREIVRVAPAAAFRVEEEATRAGLANLEARLHPQLLTSAVPR